MTAKGQIKKHERPGSDNRHQPQQRQKLFSFQQTKKTGNSFAKMVSAREKEEQI